MKRLSGDIRLTVALLGVLLVVVIASAIWQADPGNHYPPLVSLSNRPDGSRGLRLSLADLGYTVTDQVSGAFAPPEGASLAFLLEPITGIDEAEWQALDEWIEAGGTLILAGNSFGTLLAVQHYEFGILYREQAVEAVTPGMPVFTSPPLRGTAAVKASAYLESTHDDFTVLMAVEGQPVLIAKEMGAGRLILCANPYPFSNAGLKEAGNPALVLNLVAQGAPRGALIWFDEWHHGIRSLSDEVIGPENWLRYTPTGHALLLVVGIVFMALVLQGWNFGRPLSSIQQIYRRAPLEHITAIANLSRRAGHRGWALRQYHNALRRHFSRRYRISPALDDRQFVTELSRYHPGLDSTRLLSLLQRLQQPAVGEAEAVHLAAEAVDWLEAQP